MSCSPGRNEGKGMPGRGTGGAKAGSQEGESSLDSSDCRGESTGRGAWARGEEGQAGEGIGAWSP